MATGYFIRLGDKTSCGGVVIEADNLVNMFGITHARQGDRVTCGKYPGVYQIMGGVPFIRSSGRLVASDRYSMSSCPCRARFTPSNFAAKHREDNKPATRSPTPVVAATLAAPQPSATPMPGSSNLREERLEESKQEDTGIVLRLGLFFDGTGNNQGNSAITEQCRREDRQQFEESELSALVSYCARYGYRDPDEEGYFRKTPDNSYGNAASNVAHLFDMYPDNAEAPLEHSTDTGFVKAYLEGIGTTSGGSDSLLPGQAAGRGETGILGRVEQSPDQIKAQLRRFLDTNPGTRIRTLEFDIFGFSRGAAAARHFANEVLKPNGGLLAEVLGAGLFGLVSDFEWQRDACINFIGLFDTVAATLDPLKGDWSLANADNPGINLYLPPSCARKVVQLVAGSERRWNFALNSVAPHHQEIALPGVHSDVGGGYPPRMEEQLLVSKPRPATERPGQPLETSMAWVQAQEEMGLLRSLGLPGEGELKISAWSRGSASPAQEQAGIQDALVAVAIRRRVRGELSRVALRAMRELAVKHGVPFDVISDDDQAFELPADLLSIAEKILAYVRGAPSQLSHDDWRHLWARYIHLSAHWTPSKGVLINKPAPNQRLVFNNRPQAGYPQ
ncbi:phospholipase effector Tle1 domain-containing protein [Pseudomonas tohonis]|uniref:phospholipase effector Tle1 domain-containing protein n=1 Tax=Pseudomonas tohonis TaxID=2725477 RepID=UPI00255BCC89|nr:DUF2235 domain-containing protein [Pseudomonas tohonis]